MKTGRLRELIRAREFLHMPAVYDPLGGLLVQNSGLPFPYQYDLAM